ncbi:hypothetical protein HQ489_04830 [Candidatus Woesearchaeota archaeon]|nr:hypothetical protein [Candidatus Woesearchaeota archaeon]
MRVKNKVELEKKNNLEKIADGHELEIERIWEPHGIGVFTGNWAHKGTDYIGFLDKHLALAEVKFTDGKSEYVLVDATDGHQVSGFPHTQSKGLTRKKT